MMKYIKLGCFGIFSFLVLSLNVNASGVSVSSSPSSITKGGTSTISVTVSSDSPLVSVEGSLNCSGSGVSGGIDLAFDDMSNSITSKKYTYSIKPTTTGKVTCSTGGVRITNMGSADWITLGNDSTTVNVSAQAVVPQKKYSSNNNLKELSVEGVTLTPEFNKDTLEYSTELEAKTEKIKINATVEDSTASITGAGEVAVTEGDNKLEVKVTAQNGNVKTYIINAKVKELAPIEVKIDKKKYTVVRKKEALTKPILFEETTIKMGEEEIPAFKNEKSKYTLIGLKDEKGSINLYIYEIKKGKENFILYEEYTSTILTFSPLTAIDIPKEYEKTTIKIGDKKVTAYKSSKTSKFALIYGMNVETGDKGWYSYDSKENTIQRYNTDEISLLNKKINQNFIVIAILGGMIGIFLILMIVVLIKKLSKNKKNSNIIKDKIDIKELTKNSKNKTL